VSFSDMFRSQQRQKTPDVLNAILKAGDRPLMTMSMKDFRKRKDHHHEMCCFRKIREFLKSDYNFM
jgi:hypothetical protein